MGQWVSSNHNNADEYVGSSLPFCTGSVALADGVATGVYFPYITRWIQVFNNHASNSARVGFTANGVEGNPVSNSNYFVIPAGTSSARLEIKCDQIWLAGDGAASTVSLVAGYTNIPKTEFVGILSGSKGFSGIG